MFCTITQGRTLLPQIEEWIGNGRKYLGTLHNHSRTYTVTTDRRMDWKWPEISGYLAVGPDFELNSETKTFYPVFTETG